MEGDSSESVRNPKFNVKDLSEEGNKYEIRFYQKLNEDKPEEESLQEETIHDRNETIHHRNEVIHNRKVFDLTKPTIKIDPNKTTKIEYYEPEIKKKQRHWFLKYFMCCS